MSKAFTQEQETLDDEADGQEPGLPSGFKNYIRPSGLQKLKDELLHLLNVERPEIVRVVSWAASNGDRSENGDYLYGKKRLREIDRRIRFLTKRIDSAVPVPFEIRRGQQDSGSRGLDDEQIFFGATVTYEELPEHGQSEAIERTVTIVGIDEVDLDKGLISWISPVANALIKARVGDEVKVRTPQGVLRLEILNVNYNNNH